MTHRTNFKWDLPSILDVKFEEQAAEAANEKRVYAEASRLDGYACRFCGSSCSPAATEATKKAHHHHVVYRSAGGLTTLENICLLCARCHNDEHQHRISIEGNANGAPWLTLSRFDKEHGWLVWRQEYDRRKYIGVD